MVSMQTTLQLSALLSILVLATLLMPSVHAYENSQYGFSINPPKSWTFEENIQSKLFVFKDSSNYTRASITVMVNQSGFSQEDPFLYSMKERNLKYYLYQNYEGYLITDWGARVVGSLNGYQIMFNASVNGSPMRFVSVIFLETNQTFFIVCGALSPAYDNLSSVFKETIDSFQLTQTVNNSISSNNVTIELVEVIVGVIVAAIVVVAALIYQKKRRPSNVVKNL